jgi:homoserine acetyltransferase
LAREVATITYRSGPEWEERFGRVRSDPDSLPAFCADYLIENYIDYQGERWVETYDPNSLLYISKAMDMFDMSYPLPCGDQKEQFSGFDANEEKSKLVRGLSTIQMPTLVLGVQSDILFPIWQQKEISDCLKIAGNKNVTYYELDAKYGHDTFLIDVNNVGSAIKGHLEIS